MYLAGQGGFEAALWCSRPRIVALSSAEIWSLPLLLEASVLLAAAIPRGWCATSCPPLMTSSAASSMKFCLPPPPPASSPSPSSPPTPPCCCCCCCASCQELSPKASPSFGNWACDTKHLDQTEPLVRYKPQRGTNFFTFSGVLVKGEASTDGFTVAAGHLHTPGSLDTLHQRRRPADATGVASDSKRTQVRAPDPNRSPLALAPPPKSQTSAVDEVMAAALLFVVAAAGASADAASGTRRWTYAIPCRSTGRGFARGCNEEKGNQCCEVIRTPWPPVHHTARPTMRVSLCPLPSPSPHHHLPRRRRWRIQPDPKRES